MIKGRRRAHRAGRDRDGGVPGLEEILKEGPGTSKWRPGSREEVHVMPPVGVTIGGRTWNLIFPQFFRTHS